MMELRRFFKNHLRLVEKNEHKQANLDGQRYVIQVAKVDDVEIFKITLEYFYFLVRTPPIPPCHNAWLWS